MANFHLIQNHLRSIACNKTRGNKFEKICKWFLENEPYWKNQFKHIWLWNDWPKRWGVDKGIDLIAQMQEGNFWAIQIKAYDQNYYVTKQDIDSFLSESNRSIITHRLLISTGIITEKSHANEVIKGQEKPITCINLESLENANIDWSLALKNKPNPPKHLYKPRPHQKKAIDAIIKGFSISNQGQVRMACGTGKSLIGLWLTQQLNSKNTLILVPSLNLISQLYKTWVANCDNFKFNPIFVCSDKTVAEEEDISTIEFGYPITTSAQELAKTLKKNPLIPTVIFGTYQSSLVLKDACILNPAFAFDLAIADEAHKCAGKNNSDFTIITHKNSIRTKRKLYMTATPKIYSENVKNKTEEFGIEIASMDDKDIFGPVFYELLFSQAINLKLLSDYHVYISVIDDTKYKEYADKGRFVCLDNFETDARTLATQIYLAKTIKKLGLSKIITFHNSISAAKNFMQTFQKALTLLPSNEQPIIQYYDVITGELPQAERNKILKKFANTTTQGIFILGNVKCLSEGVDLPIIDGIVFVDPKGSEIDIIQSIGRVMRKSANKTTGTILIPVFVDTNNNESIELENSCFKKVWHIVRALRSHDDTLAEEIDHMRFELGKRTYKVPQKLNKITIDIPIKVPSDFSEKVSSRLVERCGQITLNMSHPEVAAQWHPTKNSNLTPKNVTTNSNKKAWWLCPIANDHEWQANIASRTKGNRKCPCCANRKVVLSNCLATTHPELPQQWHPTKNGILTPFDVTTGSHKKIWWMCPVANDHEWQTQLKVKKNFGCPVCRGLKVVLSNCLKTTHPEIATQWHATKNLSLTPYNVTAGSNKKIWWQCPIANDHEWQASVVDRKKYGCPVCSGCKVVLSNCLATIRPDLVAQWHPTKNRTLTPKEVTAGSNKKVWWLCPTSHNHEWQATPCNRQKKGCLKCRR